METWVFWCKLSYTEILCTVTHTIDDFDSRSLCSILESGLKERLQAEKSLDPVEACANVHQCHTVAIILSTSEFAGTECSIAVMQRCQCHWTLRQLWHCFTRTTHVTCTTSLQSVSSIQFNHSGTPLPQLDIAGITSLSETTDTLTLWDKYLVQ